MKLFKILPILVLFSSLNFYAQGEKMKEKREQIKTMKVAFLTTELDLTSAEAEKFWPLYNEQKEASRNLMQTAKEDEIAFQEAMLVIRKNAIFLWLMFLFPHPLVCYISLMRFLLDVELETYRQ